MRRAGFLEDLDSLLSVAGEEGPRCSHSVDRRWILGVWLAITALGVMLLRVAPAANLETQLTMVRILGISSIKLG
jgi:hypothetical protein